MHMYWYIYVHVGTHTTCVCPMRTKLKRFKQNMPKYSVSFDSPSFIIYPKIKGTEVLT